MRNSTIEILINKFIDQEILPEEQQMLQKILAEDADARQLLSELQSIDDKASEVLKLQASKGRSFNDVFEDASRESRNLPARSRKIFTRVNFAAGLAAGLIIGLSIHITLQKRKDNVTTERPGPSYSSMYDNISPGLYDNRGTIQNVDYYHLTDDRGNQWLIEGYRQDIVKPAVYNRGL